MFLGDGRLYLTAMNQPRSNRRHFLKGRSAIDAISAALPEEEGGLSGPGVGETYLLHFGRRAMACEFELCLNAGQYAHANREALAALDLVDAVEAQLTIYREHSQVMEINRRAAAGPVAVEPRLFGLLQRCKQLWEETAGGFDITSGPLSKVWGFHRRQGSLPGEPEIAEALECVGSQHLELNSEQGTVQFRHPKLELNLGSIGKGFALDRCGAQLRAAGMEDFLWHAGQSSLLAAGHRGGSSSGWEIGIGDPLRPGRRLARLRLKDCAVGTSGSAYQYFRHGGQRYGHIFDPRSGWPVQGIDSVTVVAPTAAEADALGTALYVLGPEKAVDFCAARAEVGMVMVCSSTDRAPARLITAGLSEDVLLAAEASPGGESGA